MEEDGEPQIVQVVSNLNGLSEPRFIIESEGKFYLTLAVWEYDPRIADPTAEQQEGLRSIAEDFRQLLERGYGRQAVKTPDRLRRISHFGQTTPRK